MSPRKTLFLAGILVLTTLYLYKVSIPRRESEARVQRVFRSLQEGDLASVEVVGAASGVSRFTLEQRRPPQASPQGAGDAQTSFWEISQLKGAPVDASSIKELSEGILNLQVSGPIDAKAQSQDFSTYGLDKPFLTLVIKQHTGESTEVAFGKENAFLGQRYVKVGGKSGIYLADQSAVTALNKTVDDVRSKNPLDMNQEDVRELRIVSSRGSITVTQPVVGEWRILEPKELAASGELMEAVIQSIGSLTVSEFLDGQQNDLAKYRLDKPDVRVEIMMRPGSEPQKRVVSVSLRDGGKGSYFVYDGAPSVFKTDSDNVAALAKGVDDLREHRLLKLASSDIASIHSTTSDGAPPVDITTNRTDWDVNRKLSDPVFVEELLKDIVGLKAMEFPDAASIPKDAFTDPFLKLEITKKGDLKETVSLVVGREVSGSKGLGRYARVGEAGTVVIIPDIEAKRIVPHEEALVPGNTPTPLPRLPGSAQPG